MNWKLLGGLLVFLLFSVVAVAQRSGYSDIVYLKNGSVFRGKIVEYTPGERLKIELYGANVITIQDADIERVVQSVEPEPDTETTDPTQRALDEGRRTAPRRVDTFPDLMEEPYQPRVLPPLRKTGLYDVVQLGFLASAGGDGGGVIGLSAGNVLGYAFTPLYGVGLGVSYDGYRPSRAETILSLYAEGRIQPLPNHREWFATLGAGYGFAQRSQALMVRDAAGGPMGTFSIGYRFPTMDQSEILVEYGLRYQEANFVRDLPNGDIEFRDITYLRNVIRISMVLWGNRGE